MVSVIFKKESEIRENFCLAKGDPFCKLEIV